ncbi:MAG: pilus assembly protein PilP [Bdellovibrionales bacterium]|nr:pilus assembly protein PilP [Bdellovibrionales bacterium]
MTGTIRYFSVGLVGFGLAIYLASQFITPSFSQNPPPSSKGSDTTPNSGGPANLTTNPNSTTTASPDGSIKPTQSSAGAPAPDGSPPVDPAVPTQTGGENEEKAPVPRFTDFQTFLEPFIYDPKNRKDPFKPYVEIDSIDQGEMQGPLLPLQRFDLNEIHLVGIIWDVGSPRAMFLDPTNTVHIIGKNERIGRNNGYIAMIREGEVVIVEATRKEDEVIYTTTVMKISR